MIDSKERIQINMMMIRTRSVGIQGDSIICDFHGNIHPPQISNLKSLPLVSLQASGALKAQVLHDF